MEIGTNLDGPEWSALSSAAALMLMFARRTGGDVSPGQRERIAWELDKYAPAFSEAPGAEIVARAEPVVARSLATTRDYGEFLQAGMAHGTRLLRPRDRATLGWALSVGVRTAAMTPGRTFDDYDCQFFHEVYFGSRGALSVDAGSGPVELGQIDMIRHQKDPQGLLELLITPDPEQIRFRVDFLSKRPELAPGLTRGISFAFLTCSALNVGHSGEPAKKAQDLAAQIHEVAHGMGFAERPLDARDHELGRAMALHAMPNDPILFMRTFEDNLAMFVDLPRDKQELLLKTLNALVADAATPTAYRRELITVTMAVLALGRSAKWRQRPLPPASVRR